MIHELKIQKQWADAKLAGEKPFEIRRNDRGFQKGDIVRYKVIDPKTGEPWVEPGFPRLVTNENGVGKKYESGRHPLEFCDFLITYVIEGQEGLKRGYCVFADTPVPKTVRQEPKKCSCYEPEGGPTGCEVCRHYGSETNEGDMECHCEKSFVCGARCPFGGNPNYHTGISGRHG